MAAKQPRPLPDMLRSFEFPRPVLSSMKKIAPNLYWLRGLESNAYLYTADTGCVLVDGGMPGRIDVLAALRRLGRRPTDLRHILLTHADIDHVGDIGSLQTVTGARVLASARAAELAATGHMPSHGWDWFNDIMSRVYTYRPIEAQVVTDGQQLDLMGGLRVIYTPGHTPDHVAYFSQASGILFTGDALHTRNGHLQESGRFISADYDQARHSAAKLLRLTPAVVAPGHGKPLNGRSGDEMLRLLHRLTA